MERADDTFSSQRTRGYRLTIFKQLQQAVEAMHRPEEMFQWLASVMDLREWLARSTFCSAAGYGLSGFFPTSICG